MHLFARYPSINANTPFSLFSPQVVPDAVYTSKPFFFFFCLHFITLFSFYVLLLASWLKRVFWCAVASSLVTFYNLELNSTILLNTKEISLELDKTRNAMKF